MSAPTWTYRFEFKIEDAWVGAFWKRGKVEPDIKTLDIWICLIPCLPLHITIAGYERFSEKPPA